MTPLAGGRREGLRVPAGMAWVASAYVLLFTSAAEPSAAACAVSAVGGPPNRMEAAAPASKSERGIGADFVDPIVVEIDLQQRSVSDALALGPISRERIARIRLAEAFRAAGRPADAAKELERARSIVPQESAITNAIDLLSAGLLSDQGEFELAAAVLERIPLDISQENASKFLLAYETEFARLLEAQGNPLAAILHHQLALAAARETKDLGLIRLALSNFLHLLSESGTTAEAVAVFEDVLVLDAVSASSGSEPDPNLDPGIELRLARGSLLLANRSGTPRVKLMKSATARLDQAWRMAEASGDLRSMAEVHGLRAWIEVAEQRSEKGVEQSAEAIRGARAIGDRHLELRLWTQRARIERIRGEPDFAIAAYEQALELLWDHHVGPARWSIRGTTQSQSLDSIQADLPLEQVDLLLARARTRDPDEARDDRLRAQSVIERFKVQELRDHFSDDCVNAYRQKTKDSGAVSPDAVIVYPISLEDRLELLVSYNGRLLQRTVPVGEAELASEAQSFRRQLEDRMTRSYLRPARRLHDWIIEPIEDLLREAPQATIVFVPDRTLRGIPVAALHDGERFLIERHAVAVIPSLELTDPQPLDRAAIEMFAGGLSKSVDGFPALDFVASELQRLDTQFEADVLLDGAFRREAINESLKAKDFGVVHIATHAQFGAREEDSYLLTYDGRMTMDELAASLGAFRYRDKPLELIVMSACETAAGDDRASLGLAGVAVQAGARSAIGSVWSISDSVTVQLMTRLYEELVRPGVSRAEALRRAQLSVLEDPNSSHPANWAAFVLISNWL